MPRHQEMWKTSMRETLKLPQSLYNLKRMVVGHQKKHRQVKGTEN